MSFLNTIKSFFSGSTENISFHDHSEVRTENRNLGFSISMSLLAIALVVLFLYVLQSIVLPILFALIFSVILYPMCHKLEKWGLGRAFATLISLVIGIILLLVLIYVLVNQTIEIGKNATEIIGKIQIALEKSETWLSQQLHLSKTDLVNKAQAELTKAIPKIGNFLGGFFGSVGNVVSSAILVPLIVFFFLYYRDFFKGFFVKAFYSSSKEHVENTLSKIYDVLQGYLGGLLTVMVIVAVLNTIGLLVMGIEYAWFFGILASLLMLLPYIGIAIGSILPALFALATKDTGFYALGVIVWFQVVQTLEGNFITPNVVGSKVSLNPLVSILTIFFFSMLFGFAGLILALPMTAIIKVVFDAVPELKPYGFLLSEPSKHYLLTDRQRKKHAAKVELTDEDSLDEE